MSEELYLRELAGNRWVMGIDEVGVGAWAGPVYAAAVLVPTTFRFEGLKDSKQTSESLRERQYARLVETIGPAWFWLSARSSTTIDRVGIQQALDDVMADLVARARFSLAPAFDPCLLVVDGDRPARCELPNVTQLALPKADTFVPAVMAAANIAKLWRDRYMQEVEQDDEKCKRFAFGENKGYGTKQHQQALERLGITREHRVSYRPVRQYMYAGKEMK